MLDIDANLLENIESAMESAESEFTTGDNLDQSEHFDCLELALNGLVEMLQLVGRLDSSTQDTILIDVDFNNHVSVDNYEYR